MTEQQRKFAMEAGLIYPEAEKNDVPMMPKHQAESQMMHMSHALKAITIVAVAFAAAMVAAIIVFVNGYTSRTKDWLNTITNLQQGRPAVTEAGDGIQQQPDP